jgi:hypothetical protein
MGAGVPSCETCTRSYARCDDSFFDEDGESDLACTSVPRDPPEPCSLRSTPSTISEPDGWLA